MEGKRPSRPSSVDSAIFGSAITNLELMRDRDELYLGSGVQRSNLSVRDHVVSTLPSVGASCPVPSGPPRPPKVPHENSSSWAPPRKPIPRRPVGHSSVSEGSVRKGDCDSAEASTALVRVEPLHVRSSPASRAGPSNTRHLFDQASCSLSSLAEDFAAVDVQEDADSPPPYAGPISASPTDIKRQDTQSSVASGSEPQSIIQVVRENRPDIVQQMLEQGIGFDEVDPITKRTAVMEAANLRRPTLCQILVSSGTRLHLKDADQNTALHHAAYQGDAETCQLLLNAGAQLEEYNKGGETPLTVAAQSGHTDCVLCLLNSWTEQQGHAATLLEGFLEASRSGNVSTAQAFIDWGVKPKKMKESWKPIAYAAQSGSIPMIDLMMFQKCSIKDRSPDGWTALHQAAFYGQTPMVEKLLGWKQNWKASTKKDQETALHLAIRAGNSQTATALMLHKDASIAMKDADSQQAIHHAVRNGDVHLTSLLLSKGARLDDQNKYGWTPSLIAAAYGHLPLVAMFITRGVAIEDKLGTPDFKPSKRTSQAARKGYWAEIRWPHSGARALHLALEFGHDEVASMLIASGARIDEPDSRSWRPIHYASFHGRLRMVHELLSRGASPHSTTEDGNTPMALGFRGPGLLVNREEKEQICELLHVAMHSHKKSKMKQLTGFMSRGSNKSRDAGARNKAWHTAELAALYDPVDDGDSQDNSVPSPDIGAPQNEGEEDRYDFVLYEQPRPSRLTKSRS
ncbi:hypothetical protein LTR37_005955 [Vermiconidia calcicola]|uniref:Uncharacterized protein n=1 Tax=Vermiconidia calcicola TaxID=1690605 RepID=A0ACC3NI62_9PEZI|nr:hypothetical protein LTR37_005955 [Vermiconidia calcicola]